MERLLSAPKVVITTFGPQESCSMFQSAGSSRIPKYRLHRPSGQAVARFNGIDYYLGKHGSQESRDEYDRLLGEWMILMPRCAHKCVLKLQSSTQSWEPL